MSYGSVSDTHEVNPEANQSHHQSIMFSIHSAFLIWVIMWLRNFVMTESSDMKGLLLTLHLLESDWPVSAARTDHRAVCTKLQH